LAITKSPAARLRVTLLDVENKSPHRDQVQLLGNSKGRLPDPTRAADPPIAAAVSLHTFAVRVAPPRATRQRFFRGVMKHSLPLIIDMMI